LLNIFQTSGDLLEGQDMFSQLKQGSLINEEEYSSLMGYLKERYHLVIDAQKSQRDKSENAEPITVY